MSQQMNNDGCLNKCFAVFIFYFYFLAFDLAVLGVICSSKDISGWKSGKNERDL